MGKFNAFFFDKEDTPLFKIGYTTMIVGMLTLSAIYMYGAITL